MNHNNIFLTSSYFFDIYHLDLSPKDAGEYHTEAFERLGKIYKDRKPQSEVEVIMDVSTLMADYCPEGDLTYNPHRVTLETFFSPPTAINYPENFDVNLKDSIDKTLSTVNELNELNVDEIVEQLKQIEKDLEGFDVDVEAYRTLSLAGVSVAIESTKLWHSVVYDAEHDLHEAVTGGRRNLQTMPSFDVGEIISADFKGFIDGALEEIQKNSSLFFLPTDLIKKAVSSSIAASAAAAGNMTGSGR